MELLIFMPDSLISNSSYSPVLEKSFTKAIRSNYSIACWRLPHSTTDHLIIDGSGISPVSSISLEDSGPGFILHPFLSPEQGSYYINAEIYLTFVSGQLIHGAQSPHTREWIKQVLAEDNKEPFSNRILKSDIGTIEPDTKKNSYLNYVNKAIESIQKSELKKVVAARNKITSLPSSLPVLKVYNRLCHQFPGAFISLIYHPIVGCWIGASPENLVTQTPDGIFKTTALAGTQKIKKLQDPSTISWQQKEIEEQALVSRYIINCFKSIRLREYEEDGPRTIVTGDLAHLKTDFSINSFLLDRPHLATTLLNLLHPTSAVGGMPRTEALDFIRAHEGFKRELYSGYIGPVNINKTSDIYVNIRCAQLFKDGITYYAGAGITKDSDPEKEWLETSAKMLAIESMFY